MNPVRAVALLNGKVQSYSQGLGGISITEQDIAHALGKLWHEGARLYGRVKWAGQDQYFDPLLAHIVADVKRVAAEEGWTGIRAGELEKVSKLALVEAISPKLCSLCFGRGSRMAVKRKPGRPKARQEEVLKVDCPRCGGGGIKPHAEHMLAKTAGIRQWRWEHIWSEYYHRSIQPIPEKYEALFWESMKRVLQNWQKSVDKPSKVR